VIFTLLIFLSYFASYTNAMMRSETERDAIKLTFFDGVRAHFQTWRWSFLRFLMAKYHHLVPVLNGDVVVPAVLTLAAAVTARRAALPPSPPRTRGSAGEDNVNAVDAAVECDLQHLAVADVDANTSAIEKVTHQLMQLFGILTSALSPHLATTLFVHCIGDGRAAFQILMRKYGSADRNHAVAERQAVLRCVVESHPRPSSDWVQHQYNHCAHHIAELQAAGGAPIDADTLMAHFASCFPHEVYEHITLRVLEENPTALEEMFNSYMTKILRIESQHALARSRERGPFIGYSGTDIYSPCCLPYDSLASSAAPITSSDSDSGYFFPPPPSAAPVTSSDADSGYLFPPPPPSYSYPEDRRHGSVEPAADCVDDHSDCYGDYPRNDTYGCEAEAGLSDVVDQLDEFAFSDHRNRIRALPAIPRRDTSVSGGGACLSAP